MADDSVGTAILLFADIADSTALTERLGDGAFRDRARGLDAALRAAVSGHAGSAIEGKLLGDGVLAMFPSARAAINAALDCAEAGEGAGLPLHLGIHAGDVIHEPANVFGGAVNIASRIADASAPGEVLVSETVRGLARTSLDARFVDRGEYVLKGIADRHRLYSVQRPGTEAHAGPRSTSGGALGFKTIVATDLQGGGSLIERADQPAAHAALVTHMETLEEALRSYGGGEISSFGDTYIALFDSPLQAVESAFAMQDALARHNETAHEPLSVRIGINNGEPVRIGTTLFGAPVMLALRAAVAAPGGEIFVTEVVRQMLLGKPYAFEERASLPLRESGETVRAYAMKRKPA